MGKIPNYSRAQSRETSGKPFIWIHDSIDMSNRLSLPKKRVTVQKQAHDSISGIQWKVCTGTRCPKTNIVDRETARQLAVKWMRKHPDWK